MGLCGRLLAMAGMGIVVSAVLAFGAAALAYIWWPQSFDAALATNKFYTMAVLVVVFWAVTVYTFRGIQASVKLSTFSGVFGTIVPGVILIALAIAYGAMGNPIQISLEYRDTPELWRLAYHGPRCEYFLVLRRHGNAGGTCQELKNPSRDYPLAVLLATILTVVVFVLGTLAVGVCDSAQSD